VNGDPTIARPLPHSLEAERAILGAILLGGTGADEAITCIQVDDFFLPENRKIFCHLKALREQGKPTNDSVLLLESLHTTNEIEAAGGVAYLGVLLDGVPLVSHITHYIEIMESKSRLRRCAYVADSIVQMALGANGNAAEVLQEITNLLAQLREEAGQKRNLNFKTGADLANEIEGHARWIAPGYVAKGAITEIGAKVKTGKTTLILSLVRAAAEGLDFLGQQTLKTPTVYLSEQPVVSFRQAMQRADLIGREDFHVLFHSEIPTMPWPDVAAAAVDKCKRVGAALLVVDTLPQFAGLRGDAENNSGDAYAAMHPLQQAASDGIGIILVRHERKAGGDVGDSGRGSSAFAGVVDIVLSLRKPNGNSRKSVRALNALSRFSETPAELLIELNGDAYISLGEPREAALRETKDSILADAPKSESEAVDLKELAKGVGASRASAQRAVEELCGEGMIRRVGEGKRGKPFRYFRLENPSCPTSNIEGQKESGNRSESEAMG